MCTTPPKTRYMNTWKKRPGGNNASVAPICKERLEPSTSGHLSREDCTHTIRTVSQHTQHKAKHQLRQCRYRNSSGNTTQTYRSKTTRYIIQTNTNGPILATDENLEQLGQHDTSVSDANATSKNVDRSKAAAGDLGLGWWGTLTKYGIRLYEAYQDRNFSLRLAAPLQCRKGGGPMPS